MTEPLTQGQVEELRVALLSAYRMLADSFEDVDVKEGYLNMHSAVHSLCDLALSSLRQAEPMEQQPVAWLHEDAERYDVIHEQVKQLWHRAKGFPVIKGYTIPLFARPTAAPAGCVVVPIEPTEAMLQAAHMESFVDVKRKTGLGIMRKAYKAMLSAAPGEGEK